MFDICHQPIEGINLNIKLLSLATIAMVIFLTSCGGSDDAGQPPPALTQEQQYQSLLNDVNAAKAKAVATAASSPCTTDNQCSTLVFHSPVPPCYETFTMDYSLVSTGATAASAAASQYAQAASAAQAIAPPTGVTGSCFQNQDLRPLLCLDNYCQRGFRF